MTYLICFFAAAAEAYSQSSATYDVILSTQTYTNPATAGYDQPPPYQQSFGASEHWQGQGHGQEFADTNDVSGRDVMGSDSDLLRSEETSRDPILSTSKQYHEIVNPRA